MDIVKGQSVRSGGNVLTTLSCSASGIFAICCDLTRPTITRLARTFRSTRTRDRREQYMPLVAFCLSHFLADFIICMCEFDFRQAQECLDHVVVFGERHLRHVLLSYMKYHNEIRTHLSLEKDAPVSRAIQLAGTILCR